MRLAHNFLSTGLCTANWGLWMTRRMVVQEVTQHIPLCPRLR